MVDAVLRAPLDLATIAEIESLVAEGPMLSLAEEPSAGEVHQVLDAFTRSFTEARYDALITSARDTVLTSVIRPFGLAKVLFQDSDGGNVQTIHNAQAKIWKNPEDKLSSAPNQQAYNRGVPASMAAYKRSRERNGTVVDEYTGATIKAGEADVDHIVSRDEFHKRGGYMLKSDRKTAFANDPANFAVTGASLNRSKGAKGLKEWESQETTEGTNRERQSTDRRRTNAREQRGRAAAARHLPSTAEKAEYYSVSISVSGLKEGVTMGLQQSVGLLLQEVVVAIFAEIKDVFRRGLKGRAPGRSFYAALRQRLKRIVSRVLTKWADVVKAFGTGTISGFFSNLVTTIINMFVTTGKRLVRIVREGFFALIRAVKLLLWPPHGMSPRQAAHAAIQVLASGVVVSGGVMVEEAFDKWLAAIPILTPVSAAVSTVLVGTVTGLLSVMIVYLLDKLDMFEVVEDERDAHVTARLDRALDDLFREANHAIRPIG